MIVYKVQKDKIKLVSQEKQYYVANNSTFVRDMLIGMLITDKNQ